MDTALCCTQQIICAFIDHLLWPGNVLHYFAHWQVWIPREYLTLTTSNHLGQRGHNMTLEMLSGVCGTCKTKMIKLLFVLLFLEPIPALSSWQRDGLDSEEARLSPQAGRLIRQLLDEDSDPMLSPRFYAYGQSQQYLDDTEVPPSPPNSHSFMRWVVITLWWLWSGCVAQLHQATYLWITQAI